MKKSSFRDIFIISLAKASEKLRKHKKKEAYLILKELARNIDKLENLNEKLIFALEIATLLISLDKVSEARDFLSSVIGKIDLESQNENILRIVARLKAEIIKLSLMIGETPEDLLEETYRMYKKLVNDPQSYVEFLSFIVAIYSKAKKEKGFYASLKQILIEAINLADNFKITEIQHDFHPYVAEALILLAELEFETNELENALRHLFQALNIYILLGSEEETLNIVYAISDLLLRYRGKDAVVRFLNDVLKLDASENFKTQIKNKINKLIQN